MQANEAQAQALADVERIAREWHDAHSAHAVPVVGFAIAWPDLDPRTRLIVCATVRELLERDVIRVGHRPAIVEPMRGQMAIGDAD